MKNEEVENTREADLVLPDGFSNEDLKVSEYTEPLSAAATEIAEQNGLLIKRAHARDFRPDKELEYADNGAVTLIHEFFETVARYEEGRLPASVLDEMVSSTDELLDALSERAGAPLQEIDDARVAFHKVGVLWGRVLPKPRRTRKVYLKAVFAHEAEIGRALEALHRAYVKAQIQGVPVARRKGRRRQPLRPGAALRADDRARVFQAITTLTKDKGLSVSRAIEQLRRSGTWTMRLGNIKNETWRRYYTMRGRVI